MIFDTTVISTSSPSVRSVFRVKLTLTSLLALKSKDESYADPIDRASQEEEFAFELRTGDRETKLTRKINLSLEKIKYDEFGWCEDCGVEIGVKRLEARPTATLCIDCKSLDEIKEKQLTG